MSELQFSPEQRRALGLEEGQSVRVLASSARTILLERVGGEPAMAYPWDRDLVLTADIRAFSFADVLHLIHASSKSGFLAFEHGEQSKCVYLHRGEVVFAASNQTVDRLGECLLRVGMITPEQFREARRSFAPPNKFGKILVERGYLTPRQIWNGVKVQVEEIVRSLFSYGGGTVLFWEGEVRPDNVVRLSLPTRRLIAEGLRRRDELLKFLALLEDPRVQLERVGGASLAGAEREIYEALERERSFPAVCRRAGVDPLSGARIVQLLRVLGAVQIERSEGAAPGESDLRHTDDEGLRECVRRHVKLLDELAAPIVAVEGGAGIRSRLVQVAEEASRRFPEILTGVRIGPNGSVDPEELIERALRFPGDRENEVRQALGELVSYLEFDMLNHPKIPEPEAFLDGIDELRAGL